MTCLSAHTAHSVCANQSTHIPKAIPCRVTKDGSKTFIVDDVEAIGTWLVESQGFVAIATSKHPQEVGRFRRGPMLAVLYDSSRSSGGTLLCQGAGALDLATLMAQVAVLNTAPVNVDEVSE